MTKDLMWKKGLEKISSLKAQFHTEFEKNIVFIVILLENSKNFVIFTKNANKFGEFQSFLGFSNILMDFHVFFIFFYFLEFSRAF